MNEFLPKCPECGCEHVRAEAPDWTDSGITACLTCDRCDHHWEAEFTVALANAASPVEKLGQAITDALDEAPAADVLTVVTGAFVGLTVEMVRRAGHDVTKPITVDGGKQRDITIHPPKAERAQTLDEADLSHL